MKLPGIALGLCIATLASLHAAETALKSIESQPPKDAAEALSKVLQPKAVQVVQGDKPAFTFWWRNAIPLKAAPESPAKGLAALEELTFLGVVSLSEGHRDYKDNEITAGNYSIRSASNPRTGSPRTAEFPYSACCCQSKTRTATLPQSRPKGHGKASGKATATGHPAVRSCVRHRSTMPNSKLRSHRAARPQSDLISFPAKAGGAPAELVFELVYEGESKELDKLTC